MTGTWIKRIFSAGGACAALLVIMVAGCDTHNQQDEFADQATAPPVGYTQTDESGRVVTEDADDWRTAPLFRGKVRVDPAYPNPTPVNFVTIPVSVNAFDTIRGGLAVWGYNTSGRFIRLDELPEASSPGVYIFSFSVALFGKAGLQRVFIFDGAGEIVSYGDILVQ